MNETRSDDYRPLRDHRQAVFNVEQSTNLIVVKCRCGWKGYFDDGESINDWISHLYDSSVEEYTRE